MFPAEKADGKNGAKRRAAGHHAHRQQDASRVDAEKGDLHHGKALCQWEEADDLPSGQSLLFCVFDLKNRGVEDILIACMDGLKGLPEAIKTVYPDVSIQLV